MFKSFLLVGLLLALSDLSAQRAFPTPELTDVDLQVAQLGDFVGQGSPTVVAIWATWCQPCHLELDHMKGYLDKWRDEYGARFVAVSVDKPYHVKKIAPLVARKGWKYDILVDSYGELQSRLGFRSIPQLYVLDGAGNIVEEFSGYRSGREARVDAVIRRLAKKSGK